MGNGTSRLTKGLIIGRLPNFGALAEVLSGVKDFCAISLVIYCAFNSTQFTTRKRERGRGEQKNAIVALYCHYVHAKKKY